jgi:two-component system cell cycle sensor histidine kinase/response regulator CckA
MPSPAVASTSSRAFTCQRVARVNASIAIIVGALALVGWWLGIPAFTSLFMGLAPMKPNSAVSFLCTGLALHLILSGAKARPFGDIVANVLAAFGVLIGLATLIEHGTGLDLRLDDVLFHSTLATKNFLHPGRMAASTALGLLLLNGSLLLRNFEDYGRRALLELLSLLAVVIGLVAVLGYIYGVPVWYGVSVYSSMALSSALVLFLLGLGVLLSRPSTGVVAVIISDRVGGTAVRRLLPAVVFLPVVIGWLRLRAQRAGWFGTEFGIAIVVASNVIILSVLVWANARWLNQSDESRTQAEDQNRELAAIVASADVAILSKDLAGTIVSWNKDAERLYGYTADEIIGQSIFTIIPVDLHAEAQQFLREIAAGRPVTRDETLRKRKGGSIVPVSLAISPVRDAEGRIIGASTIAHDITERKRIETELVQSRQDLEAQKRMLQSVLESMSEGLVATDEHGKFIIWNSVAARIVGLGPANLSEQQWAEHYGLYLPDMVTPFPPEQNPLARAIQGEISTAVMFVRNPALTEGAFVEANASPLKDKDGVIRGGVLAFRDITERRNREEELAQSRHALERQTLLLQSVLDSISDGLVAADENGKFILWNPAAEKIVGLEAADVPPEEWINYYGIFLPDKVTPFPDELNPLARALHGESRDAIMFVRNPAVPQGIFMEIRANPLRDRDGKLVGGVTAFRDITERRQTEETLRQSEEKFSKAFRASPVAITISTKREGRYLEVNDAYLRMLGYKSEEVTGRTVDELQVWADPAQREMLIQQLDHFGFVNLFEAQFKAKSDEKRTVQISAEIIQLNGQDCLLGTILDVTDTKRLEQQFRRAQKMDAVGRMAGGIAHDFNNLLAVIMGYGDLAQSKLTPDLPVWQHIGQVMRASERAAALTGQLLAFSRQQILQPAVLNLNAVVNNFADMLRRVVRENIELKLALDASLGNIKADPGQLEQTLMNLVVNARDAISHTGTIVIETCNADLDESFTAQREPPVEPGPYVMLSVSDSGCGMDPATMSQIFDPFFTTKPVGKGTGLGLATVYGIVRQSGGHLWVYSEPGKGTTFKMYFPRLDIPTVAPILSEACLAVEGGTETILVVEDDAFLRELTVTLLKNEEYKVLEAKDGRDALEIARNYPDAIDLLLTDVIMPRMIGPELASKLTELRPNLKVLYMSGYTANTMMREDTVASDAPLLQKPFTRSSLLARIRAVLSSQLPAIPHQ